MRWLESLIDTVFPPLCVFCNSFARSQLCPNCWELSQVIEPKSRCIHCFKDSGVPLCGVCLTEPQCPYPRAAVFDRESPILRLLDEDATKAFAGFAYYQWQQLAAPLPDYIVPVKPSLVAKDFGALCNVPTVDLFRRRKPQWSLREGLIPEDANILLFDAGCKWADLESACRTISEAFPKKVSILSLFL